MCISQFMRKSRLQGKPVPKLPDGDWKQMETALRSGGPAIPCMACEIDGKGKRGWYRKPSDTPGKFDYACPFCHGAGRYNESSS